MAVAHKYGYGGTVAPLVDLIVDPRTPDLDKTVRDIMRVTEVVSEFLPSLQLRSIEISGNLAVVKAFARRQLMNRELLIKLFERDGFWEIRGCSISKSPIAGLARGNIVDAAKEVRT